MGGAKMMKEGGLRTTKKESTEEKKGEGREWCAWFGSSLARKLHRKKKVV
jgi:hypothetical protein